MTKELVAEKVQEIGGAYVEKEVASGLVLSCSLPGEDGFAIGVYGPPVRLPRMVELARKTFVDALPKADTKQGAPS